MKPNLITPSPTLPSSRLNFRPDFVYLLPLSSAGDREWGLWSVHQVVSAAPSSSHASPAPAWGPSHRRQSSMNFSRVSPSHGLQLLHVLPQHGSPPAGSPALPAARPQPGLLSPRGHGPCQELLQRGLPTGHSLPRAPPAPAWGPARAAGGELLPRGLRGLGAQPAPPGAAPRAAGEPLLRRLEPPGGEASHRSHPFSPPLPKLCHTSPVQVSSLKRYSFDPLKKSCWEPITETMPSFWRPMFLGCKG